MKNIKMSKQELDWQAEGDARTLSEAYQIMNDKKRYSKAQDAARRLSRTYEKSANNMKLAAGGKLRK